MTTDNPDQAPGKGAGTIIAIIVGVFIFIAIIGILAAVALPAYQDYTIRAKVQGSFVLAQYIKSDASAFYEKNKILPDSNVMLGHKEPMALNEYSELKINGSGSIVITFNGPNQIKDATLILRPVIDGQNASLKWTCTDGNLQHKFRPAQCRN